jgi:hypothetical protein
VRPTLIGICNRLLESNAKVLSLDHIGDAIGIEPITPNEIEELFCALERAGRVIGALTPNVRENLGLVLREARHLKNAKHETPDVAALAKATNLAPGEVRAALLYASVLGRE